MKIKGNFEKDRKFYIEKDSIGEKNSFLLKYINDMLWETDMIKKTG